MNLNLSREWLEWAAETEDGHDVACGVMALSPDGSIAQFAAVTEAIVAANESDATIDTESESRPCK